VVVAVTSSEKNKVLAALTSAALGLPGLSAQAAVPAAKAQGNVQYGYYEESDDRMRVDIYHGDVTLPLTERLEFTFSVDRDTYSGATPAFSLPETMTNQVRISKSEEVKTDIVTAASAGVSDDSLTWNGGIDTFKEVRDATIASSQELNTLLTEKNDPLDKEVQASLDSFTASNPKPDFPDTIPGEALIGFSFLDSATYGKANMNTGTACPEGSCYLEKGIIVGSVYDPASNTGHVHRKIEGNNTLAQYHSDSAGVYFRATNGEAFSAVDLLFKAPLNAGNSGSGANDYWEILGFNTAVNPTLSEGNGTNYATRVAYQTVANGFNNLLTLNDEFKNINALWIHYNGQPKIPASDIAFETLIDNVRLNSAKFADTTPEQIAWLQAYNDYKLAVDAAYEPKYRANKEIINDLHKKDVIKAYNKLLNKMVPPNTKVKQTMQYQPVETRTQPTFSANYYFDSALLSLSGGQSTEPDFVSTFGSVNFSQELNNKLTTVTAGYSATSNEISRNSPGHSTSTHQHADNPTDYKPLKGNSTFNAFNLGLSQVLNKNALLQVSANYTNQNGYLSNPYKFVYVRGEITGEEYYQLSQASKPGVINWNDISRLEIVGMELFREARPDLRNLFSISSQLNQYLPNLDATLHLDYRFYVDDWGINSHTMEMKWYQQLPWGLSVTPGLRYYSQSEADFFAPYFLAPREDGYYSSDFRLSGYGALSGGLIVAKQFNRGIRLELGVDYYTHQGDLKLGGGGESDYADFSYWMTHANLNVDLSAPGHIFGYEAGDSEEHHHHHQEHGAPPPAGLMYAHMMDQADNIMVGYRYMYGNQDGKMQHRNSSVNDSTLRHSACGSKDCQERPTEMSMHMHMLDLMYAPTDWLNLMVMPQLVDMNMELETLSGVTAESEHGGGHKVHALGDTLMAAMLKVFEAPGHHMHLSLGLSAPTGSVEETMDGRDDSDSLLQDYGMQPGSGTWDLIPALTYTGHDENWSWGAQLNGTKRLQNQNDSGYVLGDRFQANFWGGYSFTDWLSTSIRGVYTEQDKISGQFNRSHSESASVDFPKNYGGQYWDVGFGLNLSVPNGAFAGHNFSVEWLQPLAENVNGYQLEREGSLFATWNYMF
jgi:hypothetical protein